MKTYKSFFFKMGILFVVPYFVFTSSACGDDPVTPTNPCDGIVCVRGNCVNGICVCPEGYDGADCNIEIVPLDIYITAVKVKDFPVTNGTNSWDVTAGQTLPDLMLKIHRANSSGDSTGVLTNAQEGEHNLPLPNGKITLTQPTQEYFFELYDDDSDPDDLMDMVKMIPYQAGKGFPTTIELKGTKMLIELTVEYKHGK